MRKGWLVAVLMLAGCSDNEKEVATTSPEQPPSLTIAEEIKSASPEGRCEILIKRLPMFSSSERQSLNSAVWNSHSSRGEFEKKEDYDRRISESKATLIKNLSEDAELGYVLAAVGADTKYNPDKEVLAVSRSFGVDKLTADGKPLKGFRVVTLEKRSEEREEAFGGGASIDTKRFYGIAFKIGNASYDEVLKLNPEEAREIKDRVELVMVGRVIPPYEASSYLSINDYGLHVYREVRDYTTVQPICSALIDKRDRKILKRAIY